MKKITDFIINKRYLVLAVFIIFSAISIVLSSKTTINSDITKYLPNTSETRIGKDKMDKEFSEAEKSSSFEIMFKGLTEEKKEEILEELTKIEGIDKIDYDNTEKYNKDNCTLYIINIKDEKESELSAQIYNEIKEKYQDYETYTAGEIAEANTPILPIWILVVAIGGATIILIIMCESYIEPFIFLTTILMAVILNSGTNIIFDSVSNITNSISAILQMALSMDYSIMLMNRFRQEKEKQTDNVIAMKNALYNAFTSISSSSVTTIVGLLALVFMSFTIGKDLGLVLAKGVLLSLVTIFFVLPTLILIFDKWITKTKKKSLNIKLNKLGSFSYALKYPLVFIFIFAFIGSYFLKGNLGILYTNSDLHEISEVFGKENQIAIIYKNKEEEKVAKHLKQIEERENVETLLAYGNTINEKLSYNELNNKLGDLGSNVDIEDYLLKILYYKFYNQNESNTITFEALSDFIQKEVYTNKEISDTLDDETRKNIDKLEYFAKNNEINKKRNSAEISNILGIDKQNIDDILIFYNSKNNNLQLTISDFVKFMNNDVLTNPKYSTSVNEKAKTNLKQLTKFTNKNTIQTKMTSSQMASLFGIPQNTMNDLYTYYISVNDINVKLSLSEFSNFVLTNVITNPNYSSNFNENTINSIKMLSTFSNVNTITKNMTAEELSSLFGIDANSIKTLILLKYSNTENGTKLKMADFISSVIYIKNNTNYLDGVDITAFEQLLKDPNIANNPNEYTATELSAIFNIDIKQMYNLYALIDLVKGNTSNWKITPNEFVNLILNNVNNANIQNNINAETINKIKILSNIMTNSINNTKYSYTELSNFIGIDSNSLKKIYTLYIAKNTTTKLTPVEFVNFVLNHKQDSVLAKNLNQSTLSTLQLLQKVMTGTMNNTKYTSSSLSSMLGMDKSSIDLLYGLYVSKYINQNQSMTLQELVSFILNDVITKSEYTSNFDENSKLKLETINSIMKASLNNEKYSKDEMFAILSNLTDTLDKNTVELLYMYYGSSNEFDESWKLTVEELVEFLNGNILNDDRFTDFIDDDMREKITDSKETVNSAKDLLVGEEYSRIVINTSLDVESNETFNFVQLLKDILGEDVEEFYVIGDSAMASEMSKTFASEFDYISVLTMIAIFIVVAVTFKSILLPIILVLTIQCAVYVTMGYLSITGGSVYFIAILIVQSILMGATIDYAIVYTSYYLEHRRTFDVKSSIVNSYNKSIHTILTSSSILIAVTFAIGHFSSGVTSMICKTLCQGTIFSLILILFLLPGVIAACDRVIVKRNI